MGTGERREGRERRERKEKEKGGKRRKREEREGETKRRERMGKEGKEREAFPQIKIYHYTPTLFSAEAAFWLQCTKSYFESPIR